MAQQQQPNQNPKTQGTEKNFDQNLGSNNPVKKEEIDKRDNRNNSDKVNQNLGSQKYRDSNVNMGRHDQSAR
ncbi:MAG: hypothetical protein JST04_12535 [Bdellovibrionales bacterium]|nr:hypothetical protein [Bdellovibrionales bacterium]